MKVAIENVVKTYDKSVLQNVSLNIDKPGVYLIAGPNGSGKTTLLEIIAGLRKADSGTIRVNGFQNGSMEAKKCLGFLCQQNGLRKTIKLREEMQLVKEIFGKEIDDIEYLSRFELQDYYNKRTSTLSGGTKRRFLTAMLFLAQQDIVVLDEPASGLDTYSRDEIWNTVSEYGREHIVIVSDHYLNQARLYSDEIILLDTGKIIANGSFEQIRQMCPCEKLVKVRREQLNSAKNIIEASNVKYEVKTSGTVCNIYLKNNSAAVLEELAKHKLASRDPDLEDIYFYLTGKKSCEQEENNR